MGINLPCGNTPLTTTECGGDCDEKIERLAERVSEAEEKLDTIQEGAEVNVNADWEETDPNSDAYIENKPSVNYDLSLGDSAPTVGSAVVGSAVLGTLVDIILGRGDGTEDRVSVSGTGAIQITRDGDTLTIHVPVGEIDQLRNGTDTEARAWAASVLKQWLDERIAQIPADQFLDLNKTVFANPFTWSSSTYPGSINPNLDGKPVLVLALTDGENVSYSFLNMEDLIDAYEGVAPISVNGSQISHDNSGVTAGSYGDASNQTPNFGDTFKALRSTVDAKGHVTSMSEHTVKIPDTLATQESAGLMSAEDKEKLDNVDQLYKTTCGNPIVIDDADGEVKSLNVELTPIQEGTGTPSPTNIRPISPHTSVDVRDTGINQWDEEWKVVGDHIGTKNSIPCFPNTSYYMSAPANPSNGLRFWTKDMVQTGSTRWNAGAFTTPADCYFMTFEMTNGYGTTYNNDISINYPSTDTAYHAYHGHTTTVTLPHTVYGADVDVTGGAGQETVRYLTIDGNTNIGKESTGWAQKEVFYIEIGTGTNKGKQTSYAEVCNIISNQCVATSYTGLKATTQSGEIAFTEYGRWIEWTSDSTSVAEEKARLGASPLQIAYELATPTDLQTTPTALTLYKGDNVVSSDGDMCITYLQDRGDLTDLVNEVHNMHKEVQVTLDADEWTAEGTQAVMISGLEPDDSVIVTPAPSDLITYVNAGVVCISQGTDSLTFQANTPVTVNVNILIAR